MNIGWIGLGSIGTNMVRRALGAGHHVTVFARGKGLDEVEAAGAKVCPDYPALAADCDFLGLCVFSDAQLRSALFEAGALAAMRAGSVVFIHTTGAPDLAREIGENAPTGVKVLDATFSGSAADVLARELTLVVGGEADALGLTRPIFETYASSIHHVGPLGNGQMLKLLNNLLFATNLRNAAELLRIAETQGFECRDVADVIQLCSGGSYAMRSFQSGRSLAAAMAASRPYLEKDVTTVAAIAAKAGIDISALSQTVDYFSAR